MDVFNRIKTTVSSFSTVLPGNPVTREYEITEHIASAGPGLLWKVYRGIKKSTKEEGSVFILEKKLLDKYSRQDKELILGILKKGIAHLTRLRHPSILTVQHSLEESRESLAFATEAVFASLANILGYQENMPVPPPKALKDFELFDLEIKYGILQITEGLAFLHNDVKMMHGNINPESVLINLNGAWKIAGFDFCMQFANSSEFRSDGDINIDLPPPCHPHLDYVAPERILGSSHSFAGDMFSLGVLFYAVHNNGKSLMMNSGSSMSTMKHNFNQLKALSPSTFTNLPAESRDHVKMLLNYTAELRPDAFQTSKLSMFEDVGVKTLQYLDSLFQWDNLQKSQFYKGLPQIIQKMPKRVNLHRVIPCLVKEYPTPEMVPFVLPNVLLIAEDVSKEEFQTYILQDLIPLFRLQEPVQITLIFMQKMELLLSKCSKPVITNHVLPMIYKALESDAQQIQELCLSIIPKFANLIEYSAMKNALLPRIKKLCNGTSYLSVRVNCLVCLGKLLEHLDKWLVLDEILPFLSQIPSKEPAVLMGMLGILKITMSHKKLGITKEIMASKIIPFLMPLSIENGLTLNQFNSIMAVIKEMVAFVESEHKTKLEQLNSIRQEHSSTLDMVQANQNLDFSIGGNKPNIDDMFNIGLTTNDSYSKNDVKSVQKSSNVLSNPTQNDKMFEKPFSMSFEEKKQMTWNQEQHRKWNSGGDLVPFRDATTSLIDSNLKCLTTSKALDSLSSLPLSTSYIPNNWAPPQQPMSLVTSPSQQHQSSSNSLDNLLPSIGSKSNLTLSQMSQGIRELPSSPVLSTFNNFIKPVNSAKNELEDLLG
ncbi:SCY1-like protein 2 isoform X1 [Parasteatoda tepidariorum]|uniref:SCY1-like protein 2 isoform X1 n=1 Tax=Parasteatoda tepidariorum TaxID=114398 RepID=UPI001C71B574|nr:SCY1-like protein 2 isoform X1 [Parasteatoda tepidariorum]XP_042909231.1 SCY1-like protein 2 isoform X1 [Parasteatoda tepidariorum]XP_042909232.1 SCY1-like protein 2 isoform X1 [Parasteatoda tepidariorum]